MFCLADENNERRWRWQIYNAAAAHATFVMTVSAARMYWVLCHAQRACNINIHKLHPLLEKNRLGLCQFSAQWNRIAVCILWLIFFSISVRIFQKKHCSFWKVTDDFNHENRHSGTCYTEIAMFVPCRFQSQVQSRFSAEWKAPV